MAAGPGLNQPDSLLYLTWQLESYRLLVRQITHID